MRTKFIDIFEKYDKRIVTFKDSGKFLRRSTRKVNLRALLQLLVTGIGYGYYISSKH